MTPGLIFISHSSKDEEIAEEFVDSLKAIGVEEKHIFFSAKTHMGVGVGKRFPDEINSKLHESSVIFLLLTRNYYKSANCLNEEGVAWYCMNEKKIYPIRIGIDYSEMKGFIDSTVIATHPDPKSLRDIPFMLKEWGFIKDVPDDTSQFDIFIKKANELPQTTVVDCKESTNEIILTDSDLLLLNYFKENNSPYVYRSAPKNHNKTTIEDYSSRYRDFDGIERMRYFVGNGWIVEKDDGERLNNHLYQRLLNDDALKNRCKMCSLNHIKDPTKGPDISTMNTPDFAILLFSYLKDQAIFELGDRWMSQSTIDSIVKWEDQNNLDNTLSSNYAEALKFMIRNDYVHAIEFTSFGNPRLFKVNDDVRKKILNFDEKELNTIKTTMNNHRLCESSTE